MSYPDTWRDVLTKNQILTAVKWYQKHKEHVLQVSAAYIDGFPPTVLFEKNHPELWKPQHWSWFIRHYGSSMWYWENQIVGDDDNSR